VSSIAPSTSEGDKVALVIVSFTVPLQFVASLFGFLARDPAAATGMGLLSGIWLALSLVTLSSDPGSTSDALGLFLLIAAIAMLAPALAAATGKWVPAAVLATASLRFFLGGMHQLTGDEVWENTAGLVGLVLAALAAYAAYAAELEDALGRPVLPLGRHDEGRDAVEQPLAGQVPTSHDSLAYVSSCSSTAARGRARTAGASASHLHPGRSRGLDVARAGWGRKAAPLPTPVVRHLRPPSVHRPPRSTKHR
jgi:uncharacterized protein